ncbi:MAG: hypothetical protein N2446_02675 [Elusimicrobiales bacterium]|nr:hypothetical protein [Elusimicrobiales bacterium]
MILNTKRKGKGKIGWIIIPFYIILFIILIRWTLQLYSPDIKLSEDELKAFSGKAEIKEDEDFKFYEPNLEDLTYTITYKNIHETKVDESSKYTISKDKDSKEEKTVQYQEKEYKKRDQKLNNEIDNQQINTIKQKEMTSIGYKQGFLSQAVGKLINNPKAIKALFDNEFVVKGFLARQTVKNALSDPKYLENILTNSQIISNFFNNENVKAALKNQEVINAIAQSKLMNEIISSPAVNQLLNNQNSINNIIQKMPQATELLANPYILQALSQNSQGSKLISQIKK